MCLEVFLLNFGRIVIDLRSIVLPRSLETHHSKQDRKDQHVDQNRRYIHRVVPFHGELSVVSRCILYSYIIAYANSNFNLYLQKSRPRMNGFLI